MNRKLSSMGWLVLLLPFLGVHLVRASSGIPLADETRVVSGFHAIASGGNFQIEVRVGDQESLRLEGDDATLRAVETVVENGTLKIRYKRSSWTTGRNWNAVKVYVTAKRLDAVSQAGSGYIHVKDKVGGDTFSASLSGSGRITLDSEAGIFNASISGSGRITIAGRTRENNVSISGSGHFDGAELTARVANVKIAGSGSARVHADEQLDASISGSGNVYYRGNARTNVKTSGSGKLRRI